MIRNHTHKTQQAATDISYAKGFIAGYQACLDAMPTMLRNHYERGLADGRSNGMELASAIICDEGSEKK